MAGDISELPLDSIRRFLHQQMTRKIIGVSVLGDLAQGFAAAGAPLVLKGLHVEPTENLVGIATSPGTINWVGEHEGLLIDFSSLEIGQASPALLRGDGAVLERVLAPLQVFGGRDLGRLQQVTRGVICRRFFNHYREFSRGVLKDFEGQPPCTLRRCLSAYRSGLTGVHLLRTGEVELDLPALCGSHGYPGLEQLIADHRARPGARLDPDSPWINRMARLHALLDSAYESSQLPVDPPAPADLEEYLLDMRRRFFDAHTVQQ
jgi:hypothetical protein